MKELRVELGERSYPIYIGHGLLENHSLISKHIQGSELVIITNETVGPLYLPALQELINTHSTRVIELKDGEQFKTLDTLNGIFDQLLDARHSRKTTLLALGGGVVGDMTGFAAACYQRGVPFIQIPTTLLAQVDSSVGGKTAVNHPKGKNMIGAFYQPQAVIADTKLLASLPPREFAAGMAEVIKYGLLADMAFFEWLEQNAAALRAQQPDVLATAIEKSCITKADIVEKDETEQGVRALLNLGHTFGHAIETTMQYKGILHGEAVSIGMLLAARMSNLMGLLLPGDVERIAKLLEVFDLPLKPSQHLPLEAIKSAMLLDKKVVAGSLRLVLLDRIGAARVINDFSEDILDQTLATLFD
ncbi:MAG: 3-dehydroquinate synthase [Pseudomonadales bacterium]